MPPPPKIRIVPQNRRTGFTSHFLNRLWLFQSNLGNLPFGIVYPLKAVLHPSVDTQPSLLFITLLFIQHSGQLNRIIPSQVASSEYIKTRLGRLAWFRYGQKQPWPNQPTLIPIWFVDGASAHFMNTDIPTEPAKLSIWLGSFLPTQLGN